jgi:hypothetical protein
MIRRDDAFFIVVACRKIFSSFTAKVRQSNKCVFIYDSITGVRLDCLLLSFLLSSPVPFSVQLFHISSVVIFVLKY